MRCRGVFVAWMCLCLGVALPEAWAAAVGTFTRVEGRVELLKQGRPPASAVRVQDPVEAGDAVRTKSDGRAQVRFRDDSLLTIAPGSLVTIEAFSYEREAGRRNAVLQILRGLVHCVVEKIHQTERPDFLLKTHTAVLGVRGTRWYTLLGARYTAAYTESGLLEMGSSLPELPRRVLIRAGEMSSVALKEPPTPPRRYPPAFREVLKLWLTRGVPEWVLSLDPTQLPGLDQIPPVPEIQKLPESLFVPPLPPAPRPPEKPEPPGPPQPPIEPGRPPGQNVSPAVRDR